MKGASYLLPLVLTGSLVMAIPLLRQQVLEVRVLSPLGSVINNTPSSSSAEIYAARGEVESFQMVMLPHEKDLTLVRVEPGDLESDQGRFIKKNNVTLYREHFVTVKGPLPLEEGSNTSRGPGRYADPLIPFSAPGTAHLHAVPAALNANEPVVVWVDVSVPRDTPPGNYYGTINVTTNRTAVSVPVSVTVWNFELPLKPSLNSSFALWTTPGIRGAEELLRNKLMPLRASAEPTGDPPRTVREVEEEWVRQFGLSTIGLSFWSGADQANCAMRPAPSVADIRNAIKTQATGIDLYNYTADEIVNCANLAPALQAWAQNLHAAGVKNLVVMPPTPELMDDGTGTGRSVVDIWVVLPKLFDRAATAIEQAIRKGDEVWSYSALAQDGFSPKWLIGYDPINARIQSGFMSQSLRLSGVLYWRVDRWSADPWNDVNNAGVFGFANFPGEGVLVYPGADIGIEGVAPSIRLKQLRDGVEDFEYIELLKKLENEDNALQWARRVAPNWKDWTKDPKVLDTVRRRLGAEIERLTHPEH
jgi:hypothetical protein